jgi:nitroreductase
MEVIRAVRERRSVRDFMDRGIPEGVLEILKDALIWAPSAGNLQSRKFYMVKDEAVKGRLASAALGQTFIARAPVVLVGCADSDIHTRYGERGVYLYSIQDVSASIMSMMLVAVEVGLGSAWVGAFSESEVAEVLGLPRNLRPVAIVPIGYPALIPDAPPRVSKNDAVLTV